MQDKKLIQQLIRETVSFIHDTGKTATVRLIDVFDIKVNNDKGFSKSQYIKNGYPALHCGDIGRIYELNLKVPETFIDESIYNKCSKANNGEIVVKIEDFGKEFILKAVLYIGEKPIALNSKVLILKLIDEFKDLIDLEFIAFQLNYKKEIREFVERKATGTKVYRISLKDIEELEVALPRIEVQKYIVDTY